MPVQAGKYEWSSGEDESEEIKAVGALEMKLRWELDFFCHSWYGGMKHPTISMGISGS